MESKKEKILIIIAHPSEKGHNRTILKYVEQNLKDKKTKYEIIDLYKIKFDPVLKETEHLHSKEKKIEKDILEMQKTIAENDRIIIIFPVWWNSPPAILKGFFDRVLSSGFAFRYIKILKYFRGPKPLLKGKKAAVIITSGSPKLIFRIIIGGRAAKVVQRDTLKFCGIKSKLFHYGNAYRLTEKTEKKLEKLAYKAVKWITK